MEKGLTSHDSTYRSVLQKQLRAKELMGEFKYFKNMAISLSFLDL